MAAKYGGPSQVVRDMVFANNLTGLDVEVITTSAGLDKQSSQKIQDDYQSSSTKLHIFPLASIGLSFYSPEMSIWLKDNVHNFDLLHLHVPFTYPFAKAAHYAKQASIPYIVSTHGLLDQWSLSKKPLKKKIYLELFERKRINSAAKILVTSALEASNIALQKFTPEIISIPLSVKTIPLPTKPQLDGKSLKVVCVARLHPVKEIPTLLKAIAQATTKDLKINLTIAGSGNLAYQKTLENEAEQLKISHKVKFLGQLSTKEIRTLLMASDVFALFSAHENFCLAAAEAMACGVPVILSDQVGICSDIKNQNAGIIIPVRDYLSAADALKTMSDPEMNKNFSKKAHNLANNLYSIGKIAKELDTLYKKAS